MTCNEGSISIFLYYTPLLYRKTWKEGVSSTSHVGSSAEAECDCVKDEGVHSDDPASVIPTAQVAPNERYATHENANGGHLVRCPECGTERVCRGRRSKRVYCSDACRARAWRRRVLARRESGGSADNPSVAREVIGGGS